MATAITAASTSATLRYHALTRPLPPVVCMGLFVCLAAVFAGFAPVQLTIASVFLFAGPHNWVELRYFLSKLPSRLGPLKTFFACSVGGTLALTSFYVAYSFMSHAGLLDDTVRRAALTLWEALTIAWACALYVVSRKKFGVRSPGLCIALALGLLACATSPFWFTLALVYIHPLVGMAVLDLELRRRPLWRRAYRRVLAAIPCLAVVVFFANSQQPVTDSELLFNLISQSGGLFMPDAPPISLVAVHAFLELLHYGIWLIAIPLVTSTSKSWLPSSIPIERSGSRLRVVALTLLGLAGIATVALWGSFSINYTSTRELYFTFAMAHMLAEIPLLLRLV